MDVLRDASEPENKLTFLNSHVYGTKTCNELAKLVSHYRVERQRRYGCCRR